MPTSAGRWCCGPNSGTAERKIKTMATSTGWWMYHGDPAHTGYVGSGQRDRRRGIVRRQVRRPAHAQRRAARSCRCPPSPTASSMSAWPIRATVAGEMGGTLLKIDLAIGRHGGEIFLEHRARTSATPMDFAAWGRRRRVVGDSASGKVYFVGFNAKLYCLNAGDLSLVWVTDLRNSDLAHNQPVQTFNPGTDINNEPPAAAGWSAPLVVQRPHLSRHRRGRESEPPQLRLLPRRRDRQRHVDLLHQSVRLRSDQPAQSAAREAPCATWRCRPAIRSTTERR